MSRRTCNLPKTAKEQRAWMKKLGITDIRCAKLALLRDTSADRAAIKLAKRNYAEAIKLLHLADKMQSVIENTQNMLRALK
jgi:hypothetical protein